MITLWMILIIILLFAIVFVLSNIDKNITGLCNRLNEVNKSLDDIIFKIEDHSKNEWRMERSRKRQY